MNEKTFKDRVSRLKEIGEVLEGLPAEIRALAFPLLSDYAVGELESTGTAAHKGGKSQPPNPPNAPPVDREGFFKTFDHEKPADNAKLLAGWFYREYGASPFSTDEIRQLAADVGVTIPDRIDMTLAATLDKGKKLFARTGKGMFKPTVYGEAYLKTTYGIAKGTKQRPTSPK